MEESDFIVKARPIKEGKDPLAEGNTLVNPKGTTEDDGIYELLESSEDVRQAEKLVDKVIVGPTGHHVPQLQIPKIRRVRNKSEDELAQAVKNSKRKGR